MVNVSFPIFCSKNACHLFTNLEWKDDINYRKLSIAARSSLSKKKLTHQSVTDHLDICWIFGSKCRPWILISKHCTHHQQLPVQEKLPFSSFFYFFRFGKYQHVVFVTPPLPKWVLCTLKNQSSQRYEIGLIWKKYLSEEKSKDINSLE